MSWYLTVIKKYVVFSGRARRKEFWTFVLFNFLFFIVAAILDNLLGLASKEYYLGPIYSLYALFIIIPYLAVAVRRLHDIGKSGWWIFIKLIPIIGAIWLLILLFTEGNKGPNEYGEDPKQEPGTTT